MFVVILLFPLQLELELDMCEEERGYASLTERHEEVSVFSVY